jgi:hypothetical protein
MRLPVYNLFNSPTMINFQHYDQVTKSHVNTKPILILMLIPNQHYD